MLNWTYGAIARARNVLEIARCTGPANTALGGSVSRVTLGNTLYGGSQVGLELLQLLHGQSTTADVASDAPNDELLQGREI